MRRVVEEIRRDRPSLALLFIAPIILTGLVTFILREGQTPVVHAVIVGAAPAEAPLVSALEAGLRSAGATVTEAPDEATARGSIADGSATVAIVLPADLLSPGSRTITLVTDGLDPSGEAAQLGAVQKALLATLDIGRRRGAPDHPAHDRLRHPIDRPDHELRAGHRGLLRLLLRLHPHRRQLPARAHGRDARAADGHAGQPRRDRRRLHPGLRPVRRRSRSRCS